jgi:AbrB family looped-hinge helix DNA binding protein
MDAKRFPKILGTANLNDKGQLVIPAEARKELNIKPGDRLVIMMSHNKPALVLVKAEEIEALVQDLSQALNT